MSTKQLPRTLLEASRYFADLDVSTEFVAQLRWPDGPVCPACGGKEHGYITTRRLWKCRNRECRKQFSVKQGSIFEDDAIPLDKWLVSIWAIANSKNGISSHELGRSVGITQKSAWFVLHRVRLAMRTGSFEKFDGEVEVDEAYIGGHVSNRHAHERAGAKRARGSQQKSMVVGTLQRGADETASQVQAEVQLNREWESPRGHVYDTVEPGANLYSDASNVYFQMKQTYKHQIVDHHKGEYARGRVSTNGIENFWSLLKRSLHGTYISVEEQHLFRYVDERVFAFNLRKLTDLERFQAVLGRVAGRRLTYAQLTGN